MLSIRCPNCKKVVYLSLAKWEEFLGYIELGKPIRVGLVCNECHNDFILQATLTQIAREA